MKHQIILTLPLIFLCMISKAQNNIDLQGHRGCRGLMPENSIPAFIKAIELGVNTIELDVVVTKDNKILISHEPFMSSAICLKADGSSISEAEDKSLNIYEMTYAETQTYDCGIKPYPKFSEQAKMNTKKPLLEDAIDAIEAFIKSKNLNPVKYNIEIKSTKKGDGKNHPKPDLFAKMVVDIVKQKGITERTIIQSFDVRSIREVRKSEPKITISYLVANANSFGKNITKLGFKPDYYSPYYMLLSSKTVKKAHAKNIKIAVWTVNEISDMQKMKEMGVDAIITDYPDRYLKMIAAK